MHFDSQAAQCDSRDSKKKHDNLIWKRFPHHWHFVRRIHQLRWIPLTQPESHHLLCIAPDRWQEQFVGVFQWQTPFTFPKLFRDWFSRQIMIIFSTPIDDNSYYVECIVHVLHGVRTMNEKALPRFFVWKFQKWIYAMGILKKLSSTTKQWQNTLNLNILLYVNCRPN